jgi:hypothetical protein
VIATNADVVDAGLVTKEALATALIDRVVDLLAKP